jgi:DNA replication protein DnaC
MKRNGEILDFCLSCEDIEIAEKYRKQQADVERNKYKRISERYSIVPYELEGATLINFNAETKVEKQVLDIAVSYVKNFESLDKKKLLLGGSYGVGKSHIAYAICQAMIKREKTAIFITLNDLLKSIKDTYSNNDINENDLLTIYKTVDLLALDDVGAEYSKKDKDGYSWASDILFSIFNARTDSHTILTTNLTKEKFQKKYDGRILSRMLKNCEEITMIGKDKRLS